MRDIFDDFRLTLPACAASHWWGNATADQLQPPEVASGYSDAQPLTRLQVLIGVYGFNFIRVTPLRCRY